MTQITGKLYQMYNKETGANKERRFPITVIEGVLGLSSYLQNQFSSLADIYMPIGGIYQSQTGQEFVYRATPNTIKAKSFTLDRIQGKSLAWNQLVEDVNYTNTQTDTLETIRLWAMWNDSSTTVQTLDNTLGNHYYVLTNPASSSRLLFKHNGSSQDLIIFNIDVVAGHKMYLHYNTINANPTVVGGVEIDGVQFVDLTLLYGSEISGMTDAQILAKFESEYPGYHDYSAGKLISNDAKQLETVGRNVWDEEWRNGYYDADGVFHSYSAFLANKNPIHVIAGQQYYFRSTFSIVGGINIHSYDSSGNHLGVISITNRIFTIPDNVAYINWFVSVVATNTNDICINLSDTSFNGQYEPYKKSTLPLNLDDFWVKDSQGNQVHITGGLKSAGSVRDEIVGNKYVKRVGSVDMGSLSWNESSANISVFRCSLEELPNIKPAPYSSSLVNAISARYTQKAYSPLQQSDNLCFSISDIFNNRAVFINHAYTDTVAFKTAMSGVFLNYELETPIEYELVEPLIYTMKAGTTEARISPNEDGLSAPFCCDMTYSASDNNDADNAQYAATAGRLLNTHTILGQQFNGTQDIGGAISDVSSIDGAIHFDLTNPNSPLVGISTTTPTVRLDVNGNVRAAQLISTATGTLESGTPPLTVASRTMVSNLNANYVGGKTLDEILASDITGNAATATNAKSESKDDQEFMFRKTNVDWDAKSGVVKKIKGKTLAWNQLVSASMFQSAAAIFTNNNDGSLTINGASESIVNVIQNFPFVAGHKYYLRCNTISGSGVATVVAGNNVYWNIQSTGVFTATTENCMVINVPANSSSNNHRIAIQLTDLTLATLADLTDVQFEALYPKAYYPYNPGTLISNDVVAVETTGVNRWDEEWVNGSWTNLSSGNTPALQARTDRICTKNFIKVIPGATYNVYCGKFPSIGVGYADLFALDKDGKFLRYYPSSGYLGQDTNIVTLGDDVCYIGVNFYSTYGSTYNHDICINLSNPAINGQYFPYWKRDLQLNITTKKDTDGNIPFEDGMKGVGTVQDWCDKIGGEKKKIRIKVSDLTWANSYGGSFAAVVSSYGVKGSGSSSVAGNVICAPYANYSTDVVTATSHPDKSIAINGVGDTLYVQDSAYGSAAAFATARADELIELELDTPVPFTWAEPMPSVYPCDQYGTERIISPESTTPSAPFIADLQYGAKSDDMAKELIDTRATVQPLLDAFEYDSTNEAWRLKGNFYADGFVSAYGTNESEALEALKAWVTENFEPKQS